MNKPRLVYFAMAIVMLAASSSAQQKSVPQSQPPATNQKNQATTPKQAPAGNQPPATNQPATAQSQKTAAKTLVINGQAAPGAVVQIDGRLFADLLATAQLTGATVTIHPDRIVLNMPGANVPAAGVGPPQNPQALSREFAGSAIAHLAAIREWRNAVETVMSIGVPESRQVSTFLGQHRNRAEESLRLAAVAASTPGDRNALQLVQTEFSFMDQWDSAAAAARQNLDGSRAVDPSSLQNDPLLAKINNCDRFLSDMLSSGTFSDTGVCR